ncbi:hypothetical protein SDC9_196665 [bioreactor metagenome]|uniref:Uncharacterized protein n=1 Tax=bioreactor metagenome TaxID=1076179 RepID=A0A645IDY2_9ZZZZ
MRIDKCSSPRPLTLNISGRSVSSTLNETSVSVSRISRAASFLAVIGSPSLPAKGELFTRKLICKVGSSIFNRGKASTAPGSPIVSPTLILPRPATAAISPAATSSVSMRSRPRKPKSLVILACSFVPSRLAISTMAPAFSAPRLTRPMAIRPR